MERSIVDKRGRSSLEHGEVAWIHPQPNPNPAAFAADLAARHVVRCAARSPALKNASNNAGQSGARGARLLAPAQESYPQAVLASSG
ncbi:hypothetical protein SKAU_G00237510 [Synaphobranchus kaupii]|uniref:Uncharacterized protein n=1 Tax=Synaphobranchus kaupii TaxID=118154 RepID=A0A9Q1F726_SYNKA|nr:hypothetical protein SKAU_G00237510 [Synaphobranchus kaupii]